MGRFNRRHHQQFDLSRLQPAPIYLMIQQFSGQIISVIFEQPPPKLSDGNWLANDKGTNLDKRERGGLMAIIERAFSPQRRIYLRMMLQIWLLLPSDCSILQKCAKCFTKEKSISYTVLESEIWTYILAITTQHFHFSYR